MNLLDYFKTFKVDKTPEAITEMANMILSNTNLLNMIGQGSPEGWAQTALSKLKDLSNLSQEKLNEKDRSSLSDSTIRELKRTQSALSEAQKNLKRYSPGTSAYTKYEKAVATNQAQIDNIMKNAKTVKESALDEAYRWITGDAQPTKKSSFVQRFAKTSKDLTSKIANELSNVANKLDFGKDVTPEERKALEAQAGVKQSKIDELMKSAQALGLETPKITRTESGWIPTSEVMAPGDRTMREGEATIVAKNPTTGTFEIKGAQTGNVLATAPTEAEALALQTQRQSGGTPSVSGRPDLYAIEPTQAEKDATYGQAGASYVDQASGQTITPSVATPEQLNQATTGTLESFNTAQGIVETPTTTETTTTDLNAINPSTGLPNSMNELTGSLTPQDLQDLQATYNGAQTSDDMISKVMNFQQITDEDMKGFLTKAKAENDPYYNQIFTRAGQDFEYSLNFMKQQREMQLEQERLAYDEKKRAEQANLEASGMTNTGEAVRRLGKESAFTREQLGSILPEGTLPTEQRLMVTNNLANFQKNLRDYTRQAEDVYGSSTLGGLSAPTLGGEKLYQAPTEQVYGSLQREQTTNEQVRASQLAEEERKRRAETLAAEGGVTTV
jgi:hypothetical protein